MSGLKKALPDLLRGLAIIDAFLGAPFMALLWTGLAGDRERRLQNRAAQEQWRASLRDRQLTMRSADMPRSIAYGETVVGGDLVYGRVWGINDDYLSLVIALAPGHELTGIDEVYVGERAVGTLDGSGYPTGTPFLTTSNDRSATHTATATGSAAQVVTLPSTPVGGTVQAFTGFVSPIIGRGSVVIPVVSVAGANVTLDTSGSGGQTVAIQYRTANTQAHVRVQKYLGTAAQTADADLITNSAGEWTSNHRGRGQPYLIVTLYYDDSVFPTGLENIKAKVRGKKIYDPRKDSTNGGSGAHRTADPATWEYSTNPALCARDYFTSALGFGCAHTEIDDALVIAAANVCDELVTISAGGATQKRYECHTVLSTADARLQNLQALVDSMAGYAVWSQGRWRIFAGAYTAPAITLTDADLADTGDISVSARVPRAQLFNAVKGTYADPKNDWQPTDFPPVTNATYETQDGGERLEHDLTLPATTDGWMAQRLAKIALERARQALTVQASFKLTAYRVTPGDIVALTISRYGFSGKAFRVLDREFSLAGGVRLTLREEAAGVYDWAYGQATQVDLAPNSTLPDAFASVAMPALTVATGSANALLQADGSAIPRLVVTWTAVTDRSVVEGGAIEVEWLSARDTQWRPEPPLAGNSAAITLVPVLDGEWYQVRARTRTGVGVRSTWAYSSWVLASGAGWYRGGESLCPDPLFRDEAFWTESLYTTPGWWFANADGTNSASLMGVPRTAVLWSGGGSNGGAFTGTDSPFMWSREIPFSAVGQVLRVRARGRNTSNRDGGIAVRFRDVNKNIISDYGLAFAAGSGVSTASGLVTVPSGTAWLSFYTYLVHPGPAFSGIVAVSEVKLDPAATTADIDPNAVTQFSITEVTSGSFAADFIQVGPDLVPQAPALLASLSVTAPADSANVDLLVEATGFAVTGAGANAPAQVDAYLWLTDQVADSTWLSGVTPDQRVSEYAPLSGSSPRVPIVLQRRYSVAPGVAETFRVYGQVVGARFGNSAGITLLRLRVITRRR